MTARIYIRVSRAGEETILENQRLNAMTHATENGYGPDRITVYDEGIASGAEENRPGLGRLLRELRRGDLVIFTSLSRMTRGGIGAALDILRQIERIGAGWHFTEQPILNWDTQTPKLARDVMFAVFAAIDEDYRRRISQATKAALARRRALGVKLGGRKPGARNRCRVCGAPGPCEDHPRPSRSWPRRSPPPPSR